MILVGSRLEFFVFCCNSAVVAIVVAVAECARLQPISFFFFNNALVRNQKEKNTNIFMLYATQRTIGIPEHYSG